MIKFVQSSDVHVRDEPVLKKIKEPGVGPKVIKTSCNLTYLTSPNQTILRPRVDVLQAYGDYNSMLPMKPRCMLAEI